MGCGTQAVFTKVCVEPGASPHTFDTDSELYWFYLHTLGKRGKLAYDGQITGSRSHLATQVQPASYIAYGDIAMRLNAGDLDNWLPRILGGTEQATDIFPLADTLPSFGVLSDKVAETEEVKDCVVSRAIIRGKATQFDDENPEPIELILQVVGKEHATGTTFPAAVRPTGNEYLPYMFSEATLTIAGTARTMYDFVLVMDNQVQVRFANSTFPVGLCPSGRLIRLQTTLQFNDDNTDDLFEFPSAGATVQLKFTKSNVSTTFDFILMKAADNSPPIRGRGEVPLSLDLWALKSGSTNELIVTNDRTP